MPEYRRFIAYFYEYINGRKQKNAGFAKVELRNGMWRILFRLTMEYAPDPPIQMFGFVRENGYLLGIPMGVMREGREISEEWAYRADAPIGDSPYYLENLAGIWIQSGDGRSFLTVWDDEAIDPAKFVLELPDRRKAAGKVATGEQALEKQAGDVEVVEKPADDARAEEKLTDNVEKPAGDAETADDVQAVKKFADDEKTAEKSVSDVEAAKKPADDTQTVGKSADDAQAMKKFADDEKTVEKSISDAEVAKKSADDVQTVEKLTDDAQVFPKTAGDTFSEHLKRRKEEESERMENSADNTPTAKKDEGDIPPDLSEKSAIKDPAGMEASANNILTSEKAAKSENPAESQSPDTEFASDTGMANPASEIRATSVKEPESCALDRAEQVVEELFRKRPGFQPFSDEEITDCVMLMPCDIIRMQQEHWQVGRSSFLQHGYYRYRHLLLGKRQGSYILGVPGVRNPQEEYMAGMFGYRQFKKSGVCECGKLFGYWYRALER